MSMSWSERAARRGAITEGEFLTEMREAGFMVVKTRPEDLWEFAHPDTPRQRYVIKSRPIEPYSQALPRLKAELDKARRHAYAK